MFNLANVLSLTDTDTVYEMGFDFTSAEQRKILEYLQKNNYQLIAYKGASGPNQVSAGLPTWFSVPFGNMFGKVTIDYTPLYKLPKYDSGKGANVGSTNCSYRGARVDAVRWTLVG